MAFTVYAAGVNTPAATLTATAAITSPVAAGDTIILSISAGSSTNANVDLVTDTKGNVYNVVQINITGLGTWQFTCQNAKALTTSDSVTVTFSTATAPKIVIVTGIHGAAATGVLVDQYAQAGGSTNAPSATTPALLNGSELAVALISNGNSGNAPTLAGGWTQAGQAHATGNEWLTVAYKALSGTSAVTISATLSNTVPTAAQILTVAAQGGLPARWLQSVAGAPTQAQFQVVSKTAGATSVRLKIATDPALTQNVTFAPAQIPDTYGYVRHTAANLAPFTTWYYQLADTPSGGSESLIGPVGKCKTLPPSGSPQSFRVALVSCVEQQVTDVTAIDDWVAWNADLYCFTGDQNYSDTQSTDFHTQVQLYEIQIAGTGVGSAASQTAGYRSSYSQMHGQAFGYYCRSDHEAGPDNGDSGPPASVPWIPVNIAAAQQVFPFGTLGDVTDSPPTGLWQSWTAGRIRFIMIDIRNTSRSPGANTDGPSKTMLGATQLAWFYNQLLQPEPLKIIVEDTQWAGPSSPTLDSEGPDKWWSYSYERSQIIAFLAANADQVGHIAWWHGDSHLLGVMTPAANATWGGFPVYCAAPQNNTGGGLNTQVWSSFYDNNAGNCRLYGRITITDDGTTITMAFVGWDAENQVSRVTQTDTFHCPAPVAALPGTFGALIT